MHRACQRLEEVEAAFGGIDTVESRSCIGMTRQPACAKRSAVALRRGYGVTGGAVHVPSCRRVCAVDLSMRRPIPPFGGTARFMRGRSSDRRGLKNEYAATRRSAGGVGGESGFKQIL